MDKLNEFKFKKMMEPIAKENHLVMKKADDMLEYSYDMNSREWVGEKRVPEDCLGSGSFIEYNFKENTCHIRYALTDVTMNSIDELRKYIINCIEYCKVMAYVDRDEKEIMPIEGSFECWKKCKTIYGDYVIVKLEVPEDALRYQQVNNFKFRVSKAKVLGFYDSYKHEIIGIIEARPVLYDEGDFKYRLGEMAYPDSWDNRPITCSNGLHAFMNFEEARNF